MTINNFFVFDINSLISATLYPNFTNRKALNKAFG